MVAAIVSRKTKGKQIMNINEFVENVVEQFDDVSTVVTPETKFREIDGWCSIVALSIIAMADEEYDVMLKGEDIKKSETIKDIFDIVSSRKA